MRVLLDGHPIADVEADKSRPDVAAVFGSGAERSGWAVEVDLTDVASLSAIDVIADDRTFRRDLGRRRVAIEQATARAEPFLGAVDHPVDGQYLDGAVVPLWGWCISADGVLPDVVDVYVDDRPAVRARRCDQRLDVLRAGLTPAGAFVAAGFSAILPVDRVPGRTSATIRVVARMPDGALWEPPPTVVALSTAGLNPPTVEALRSPFSVAKRQHTASQRRRRPQVTVIAHSLNLGGGELWLQELLLRMARDEVADFHVISPSDGLLRAELEAAGIGVHITSGYGVDPLRYGGRLAELGALIGSESDLVIANTAGVFPAVDAALEAGVPVIWAVHESFDLDVFSYLNWGISGLHPVIHERWLATLAKADLVVFESEATKTLYENQIPGLSGRCIRYGIDLSAVATYEAAHERAALRAEAGFAPADRVLLCMGVFQERKAQLALVQSFAGIARTHPHARLVLVGEHPTDYASAIRRAVADLGLENSVRIEPIAADIYRWYRCADVLASASDTESLPRSVLEAMAFGVPVLAADVFGLSEVVSDGVNGWLFGARDGAALVAGLRRVVTASDDELATMSAQCRAAAQGFDGANYASAFAELIRRPQGLGSTE